MKLALKITLGVALAIAALSVGCGALVSVGFNEVQKATDKHAITQAQFDSVKTGARGNTRKRILARFGEPQVVEFEEQQPPGQRDCIYYNRRGELISTYEFCFDARDRVTSKALL